MNYLISIKYDGSKFYGFQRLKDKETVQKKLEEALTIINKKEVAIKGAGRTDRGVHANDQKASFHLDVNIDETHLQSALNSLIEPYIHITNIKIVTDNFHARFNTTKKEYIYKIYLGEYNPLLYDYYYEPNYKIDIKAMKKCAKTFIGIHNFKNFVSGTRDNYNCIIYNISFKKTKNVLEIKFTGKSFYRYMVRNLVGTMLDVSNKRVTLEDVKEALTNPNIQKQFTTASPRGLYLNKIYYEGEK